ncbi:DUF2812 domain-containing protein [Dubosiella newyorkensis]|jgi:hypothetical protein|uniref:DUF2812 domain-containing protein n=1 Tax=Dubosiella newyorkensis TaxID=1862672 RepID=UPI002352240C|nr:DUF2812 domain-containing protein [Dubosiella newyorkensis]MCI9041701.1 DUF2812 domain-containing protein [Dubosiella newyorkensis]
MADEKKPLKRSRALDELEELNQQDRISSIQFSEPELRDFDAASIFEIDEEHRTSAPKRKIFGKRASRKANVKVKTNTYETKDVIQEEIRIKPVEKKVESTRMQDIEWVPQEEVLEAELITPSDENEADVEKKQAVEEQIEEARNEPEEDPVFEKEVEEIDESEQEDQEQAEYETDENDTIRIDQVEREYLESDDLEDEEDEDDEEDDEEDEYENEFYDEEEQDLYEDRKRFLLSQYPLIEEYLNEQSEEGYHFVRHVGKKYYFVHGEPKPYYYSINYFKEEPSADEWRKWENEGWKLIAKAPAKKKNEAGWFIFRNLQNEGEYKKEIDNEEEKYRFFRKYANSCRSTMFLIFICMACCIVTAFLQYEFQGYLWGLIVCGVLFLIAFIAFCEYGRMLRSAKKRARLLQARLRIKEKQLNALQGSYFDTSESEFQLESDWDTLEKQDQKKPMKRRKKEEEDD